MQTRGSWQIEWSELRKEAFVISVAPGMWYGDHF